MFNKNIISPFLFIYKPQLTSMFSILHRVTGVILVIYLYIGCILFFFKEYGFSNYYFYKFYLMCFLNKIYLFIFLCIFIFLVISILFHIIFGLAKINYKIEKKNTLELNNVYINIQRNSILLFSILIFIIFCLINYL